MQVALLLLCLVMTAWGQIAPGSPCPAVFQYRLISPGYWGGHIVVPAPAPGVPLIVTVKLFVRAILPQGQSGGLRLWYDKSLITRKIADQLITSIDYEVLFPIQAPLPQVDQIVVNNIIVCQGPTVTARVVTRVTLEHSLTPAMHPLTAQNSGQQHVPQSRRRPSTPSFQTPPFEERWPSTSLPYRRPTTPPSIEQRFGLGDDKEDECGISSLARPLIVRGTAVERGEWPWLAAVFVEKAMEFICGATLIGVKHVVTAGHCIQNRNGDEIKANELAVVLGKHDLKRWAEPMNQAREVNSVHIHPDFNYLSMTADIAIIKLNMAVTVTTYVRPICIWDSDPDLAKVVDKIATVVGWGRDEFQEEVRDTPHLARVPIVTQEECLRSRPEFRMYTSERTLCAGFRNGTGPCSGDSGGGLVLPVDSEDDGDVRWYLRGVVSLSLSDKLNMICDLREYVVYTDVGKYVPWVQQVIRRSK